MSYVQESGKWLARIYANGTDRYLGVFADEDAAAAAYVAAFREIGKARLVTGIPVNAAARAGVGVGVQRCRCSTVSVSVSNRCRCRWTTVDGVGGRANYPFFGV